MSMVSGALDAAGGAHLNSEEQCRSFRDDCVCGTFLLGWLCGKHLAEGAVVRNPRSSVLPETTAVSVFSDSQRASVTKECSPGVSFLGGPQFPAVA